MSDGVYRNRITTLPTENFPLLDSFWVARVANSNLNGNLASWIIPKRQDKQKTLLKPDLQCSMGHKQ